MLPLPKLKPGDKIAIAAPARKVSVDEMQGFIKWCEQNKWEVIISSNLFASNHQFSGTDEQRINDFNTLLSNPDIKAIFCARGGYGSAKIIDQIKWGLLIDNPKWICGYSDITAIHQHLLNKFNIPSLHCLMPISFTQYDNADFHKSSELTAYLLKTGDLSYSLPETFTLVDCNKLPITGGNLSVLYSLMGSVSLSQNINRIVFIEDLDEYLYHIDRMFNSLSRSNFFEGVRLIISGGLTNMHDNITPFGQSAEEIIASYAQKLDIPYASNFPVGHIAKNFPIPIGWNATIKDNKITFVQP
ncbi:MAG: LD-carboxypeptidase [Bacteroidia bacterium]|nr:LD-carboxypeptidase [Bacteroidia bacterium]MCO5252762.1 LD-carboxypeptidase [Bacteroidota bacterium]MCZ2130882.1 LD-carboxypeptidase [Bacteroidia bacterium]